MNKNRSLNAKSIRARARTINLPRPLVDEVVSNFLKWNHHNGPEWAVSRMKDIKAAVVYQYATGSAPSGLWVKYSKNRKRLGGIWGSLADLMISSRKKRKAVLQLLSISSSIVASQVTKKQRDKFVSSATGVGKPVPVQYHEMLEVVARELRAPALGKPRDLVASRRRRASHESRILTEFYDFFLGDEAIQVIGKLPQRTWEQVLQPVVGSLTGSAPDEDFHDLPPYIGEIQYTQEYGHKCRFFASPHLWLQQALEPLKKGLFQILREVPWDGTHDQGIADEAIRTNLAAGRTVHCFDLSDATNVFPLELQRTVVRSVLRKADLCYMDLFDVIAELPWKFEGKPLYFKRGQALGLGPSFAMFALTHGLLLKALNKGNHDDKFFVIGDDVVILDDSLAEAYEKALKDLDLPFSPLKTLRSNRIAEFAGFVFTPDEGKFQAVKWKGARDENLLDMIRLNGVHFINTLKREIQPFLHWLVRLPEPIGLGFNPEGLSYLERADGVADLLWLPEKEPQGQYDLQVIERVVNRLSTLPDHIHAHIHARWLRNGQLQLLQQAEQAAVKEASKVFSNPRAKEITQFGNSVGRLIRLMDTNGDVNLPLAVPEKFDLFRKDVKLGRLKLKRKELLPYYELWQQQGCSWNTVECKGSIDPDLSSVKSTTL